MKKPTNIVIEPTNVCTLKCEMCPRHWTEMDLGIMDWFLFDKILSQIDWNPTIVLAWRGEPLLHPRIAEMVECAATRGKVVIATNGMLAPTVLGPWTLNKLGAINVSIHNPASYKGLEHIIHTRAFATGRPHVQASYVEGEDTGCDPVSFAIADSVRVYRRHSDNGVFGAVQGLSGGEERRYCNRLLTDLVIGWDGTVSRCCYDWVGWPLAELSAEDSTLDQIWQSPQMKKAKNEYPEGVCKTCDQWQGEGKTL